MNRIVKLVLTGCVVGAVIGGIWLYGQEKEGISIENHPAKNAPLIGKKNNTLQDEMLKNDSNADLHSKDSLSITANPEIVNIAPPQTHLSSVSILPTPIMPKKIDPALLGNLPAFDFKDLYSSLQDNKINTDLNILSDNTDIFVKSYKGKVAKLKPAQLLKAIKSYESIQEMQYKIGEMPFLSRDLNLQDPVAIKMYSKIEQKDADFTAKTTFFTLELMKMPSAKLNMAYKDKKTPGLIKYKPFLEDVRKFSKYSLSEDLEKMSIQKNITANEAWADLYNNILTSLSFNINGESFNFSQSLPLLKSNDSEIRKKVTKEIALSLKNNAMPITMSINSIIKDKVLEDRMRGYASPISYRNLKNGVSDEVVNTLISTVKKNYVGTIQRYYKLKAKLLNLPKLSYSDRLAPMPFENHEQQIITWDKAKNIVTNSYKQFSPTMAGIADKFFTNGWIDARLLPNKVGGAYCDTGIPSNHPYILLNYNGTEFDVLSIAHELGHGIHSMLSYPNGMLMYSPGLTMAEVASLFGEQLTLHSLVGQAKNNKEKASLISQSIERYINAAIISIVVADFENNLHAAAKNGELSTSDINAIWSAAIKEAYGDSMEIDELDGYRWASIGHIFRTPFYYYAYSFSQLLVNSIYNVYEKNLIPDFESKMINLLSSGSTKSYNELLKLFGLDVNNPQFWQNGIDIIVKMIDDFEKLVLNDSDIKNSITDYNKSKEGFNSFGSGLNSGGLSSSNTVNNTPNFNSTQSNAAEYKTTQLGNYPTPALNQPQPSMNNNLSPSTNNQPISTEAMPYSSNLTVTANTVPNIKNTTPNMVQPNKINSRDGLNSARVDNTVLVKLPS